LTSVLVKFTFNFTFSLVNNEKQVAAEASRAFYSLIVNPTLRFVNCSIGAQKSFGLIKIAPKATNKRPQYPLLVRPEQEIPADDVIDFDDKKPQFV
jgi:hypothetical protein